MKEPGPGAETFKVDAQGGATWDAGQTTFQTQGPLFIDVGTATYLGRLRFRNRSSDIADATFTDTLLLQVADTENGVRTYRLWTITGDNENPTTVKATFAKLTNGSYGYVKNKTKLSNEELSLFGSSGNEAP